MKLEYVIDNALSVRLSQVVIHELMAQGHFKVPIHLALGHELVAASITSLSSQDNYFLSHRNLHFNLASGASLKSIVSEFRLESTGVNHGRSGSMNLAASGHGVVLSSSILGGQVPLSVGYCHAKKSAQALSKGVVWCVLGDGAIEEGVFYESMMLARWLALPVIFVVEDNKWSLATEASERRGEVDFRKLANSLGLHFDHFDATDSSLDWLDELGTLREIVLESQTPGVVHFKVETIGGYQVPSGDNGTRTVNYHSGLIRPLATQDLSLPDLLEDLLTRAEPHSISEASQRLIELRREAYEAV